MYAYKEKRYARVKAVVADFSGLQIFGNWFVLIFLLGVLSIEFHIFYN